MTLINDIGNSELFAGVSLPELANCANLFTRKSYREGERLYSAITHSEDQPTTGSSSDTATKFLYIIISGKVRIDFTYSDDKEYLVQIIGPGQITGETELLTNQYLPTSAIALEPCEVLQIRGHLFEQLKNQSSKVSSNLLTIVANNLYALTNTNVVLDPEYRLATLLANLAKKFGEQTSEGHIQIDLHLPQERLADMLGTTRQTMTKWLASWRKKNWIDVRYGKITVKNIAALENINSLAKPTTTEKFTEIVNLEQA